MFYFHSLQSGTYSRACVCNLSTFHSLTQWWFSSAVFQIPFIRDARDLIPHIQFTTNNKWGSMNKYIQFPSRRDGTTQNRYYTAYKDPLIWSQFPTVQTWIATYPWLIFFPFHISLLILFSVFTWTTSHKNQT